MRRSARAAIIHTLQTEADDGGHCWTAEPELLLHAQELVDIPVEKLAEALKDASVTIRAKVADGESLYGSVDAAQIAKAVQLLGFPEIAAGMVQLEENIKALGTYDVPVKLHPDVTQPIKVWVVAE